VPIPRRCPDCTARDSLRIHDTKDRTCRLADRSHIRVCDVRCEACGATRRVLPPFAVPIRRYGAPTIAAALAGGEAESSEIPEESTVRRWRVAFPTASRSSASRIVVSWAKLLAVREIAHVVRPGGRRRTRDTGGGRCRSQKATTVRPPRPVAEPPVQAPRVVLHPECRGG